MNSYERRTDLQNRRIEAQEDREFQARLCAAVRATGSGCTGFTEIDGHSHSMNGSCDNEVPYEMGGPA